MHNTVKPSLDEYGDIRELLPCVEQTFPTEDSVKWFVRRNRQALADSGALIIVAGRMRIHPELFQGAAVDIGRRQAGKGAAQ